MKRLVTVLLLAMVGISVFGQSSSFRAAGLYQRAKDLYEERNYTQALSYAKQSRETLEGSNERLQYLFIMIYVKQNDWVSANKEMQRFYDLLENREKNVWFRGTTEKLTPDEEAELTKMMIIIEEKATYAQSPEYRQKMEKEELEKKKEEVAQEIRDWFNKYVRPQKENSERVASTNTTYTRTMTSYVTINPKETDDFYVSRELYLGVLDLGFRNNPGTATGDGTKTISAYTSIKNISYVEYIGYNKYQNDYEFESIRIHFTKNITFNYKEVSSSQHGGARSKSETGNYNYITLTATYCNNAVVDKLNALIKKYQSIK
jgi:hypothetical protein